MKPLLLPSVAALGIAAGAFVLGRATRSASPAILTQLTFREGTIGKARFAPDGETVVYSAAWDGKPSETFVVSRNATEARPLDIPESEVLAVSKSAELAILLRRDRATNQGVLARVPLAGGTPREVADNVLAADWSPDGTNLAIVRPAQGKIRVESTPGLGTAFTLKLPIAPTEQFTPTTTPLPTLGLPISAALFPSA